MAGHGNGRRPGSRSRDRDDADKRREAFLARAREALRSRAPRPHSVTLVRETLADLDTPLSIFLKLDDGETTFLFESMEGGEQWSRFSVIGTGARATLRARGVDLRIERAGEVREERLPADRSVDPLSRLRELLDALRPQESPELPGFAGGAVGFLAYDWVRYVERLPDANPDTLEVPDAFFRFPELVLVHDRRDQRLSIVAIAEFDDEEGALEAFAGAEARIEAALARLADPLPARRGAREAPPLPDPVEPRSNTSRERYCEIVEACKRYIREGDIFQVVPSQRFSLPLRTDPLWIYRQLRALNPSPYLFFLRAGGSVVLGSSPEILVRLDGDEIHLRPIAGTHPRGANGAEDERLERALRNDPKERAEHVMLVDLGRNDIGRVAEIGSVRVAEYEVVERYSHVMHLVSDVRGRLRPDCDAVDLLRATFPAGTLSGAPKVRAMEIIDELESERRGLYGGCVGYIDYRGHMDMCIAIRTLFIQNDTIYLQAGGGVVADSDPVSEYEETLHKAGALLRAIELAGSDGEEAP